MPLLLVCSRLDSVRRRVQHRPLCRCLKLAYFAIASAPLRTLDPSSGPLGMLDVFEKLDLALPPGSDPSPFPHHRTAAEQSGLDGERIVARHIPARVDAAQIGILRVFGH